MLWNVKIKSYPFEDHSICRTRAVQFPNAMHLGTHRIHMVEHIQKWKSFDGQVIPMDEHMKQTLLRDYDHDHHHHHHHHHHDDPNHESKHVPQSSTQTRYPHPCWRHQFRRPLAAKQASESGRCENSLAILTLDFIDALFTGNGVSYIIYTPIWEWFIPTIYDDDLGGWFIIGLPTL